MRVVFVERESGPERLVCEAEVVFEAEAGPLAGMKLVGFSLWRSPEGEVYVTFPSRAFGAGNERRFFDYLRSVEGQAADCEARQGVDPRGVPMLPRGVTRAHPVRVGRARDVGRPVVSWGRGARGDGLSRAS